MKLPDYSHIPRVAHYRLVTEFVVAAVAIGTLYGIFNSALTGDVNIRTGHESKLTQIAKAGN